MDMPTGSSLSVPKFPNALLVKILIQHTWHLGIQLGSQAVCSGFLGLHIPCGTEPLRRYSCVYKPMVKAFLLWQSNKVTRRQKQDQRIVPLRIPGPDMADTRGNALWQVCNCYIAPQLHLTGLGAQF